MGQINVINCVSVTKILIRTIATWAISKIFGCDRAIVLLFCDEVRDYAVALQVRESGEGAT